MEPIKVYNFEVVDWHTYFVSDKNILVHNTCQDGSFSRVMSKAELDAVNSTGLLRGGREGRTYFTSNYYQVSKNAQKKLALENPPEVRVDFKIKNDPNVIGPRKVDPANNQPGGGTEYFTTDPVEVTIKRVKELR